MDSSRSSSPSPSSPSPSSPSLADYGWDDALDAAFAGHRDAGLLPVRVVRVDRGRCDAVGESGPVRAATPRGLEPCTGDWAALAPGDARQEPRLTALLPRRTAIVRSSAGRDSRSQVLAANVDTVVLAVPMGAALDAGRLERLLALAWDSGARPVLALTKTDRAADPGAVITEAAGRRRVWRRSPPAS